MPMPVKSHSAPQMRSRLLQQLLDMGFRVSHLFTKISCCCLSDFFSSSICSLEYLYSVVFRNTQRGHCNSRCPIITAQVHRVESAVKS